MNNNNNTALDNNVSDHDYVRRNFALLPRAECVSIHAAGNKIVDRSTVHCNAYIVMVRATVNGKTEWRPENEWLHMFGMKCKTRAYADSTIRGLRVFGIDKARAAKEEIREKWGNPSAAPVPKAKKTAAEKLMVTFDKMSPEEKLAFVEAIRKAS